MRELGDRVEDLDRGLLSQVNDAFSVSTSHLSRLLKISLFRSTASVNHTYLSIEQMAQSEQRITAAFQKHFEQHGLTQRRSASPQNVNDFEGIFAPSPAHSARDNHGCIDRPFAPQSVQQRYTYCGAGEADSDSD